MDIYGTCNLLLEGLLWAPETMKNQSFGHLQTMLFAITTILKPLNM